MGDKKQFSSPSAYAGNRRGRKAAAIIGGVCALGVAAAVLLSYMMPPTGFVASIDFTKAQQQAAMLRLKGTRSGKGEDGQSEEGNLGQQGEGSHILRSQMVSSAYPTSAEEVLTKYVELRDAKKLDGAQIITDDNIQADGAGQTRGIFYTFFLSYQSDDSEAPAALNYNLSLTYSRYVPEASIGSSLLPYLRIMIAVEQPGKAEERRWFAMSLPAGVKNGEGDTREALSKNNLNEDGDRIASFGDGDTYYCDEFDLSSPDKKLLGAFNNLPIYKNAVDTRFTVCLYLEGYDRECQGSPMVGETLAVNAEFSINPVE